MLIIKPRTRFMRHMLEFEVGVISMIGFVAYGTRSARPIQPKVQSRCQRPDQQLSPCTLYFCSPSIWLLGNRGVPVRPARGGILSSGAIKPSYFMGLLWDLKVPPPKSRRSIRGPEANRDCTGKLGDSRGTLAAKCFARLGCGLAS